MSDTLERLRERLDERGGRFWAPLTTEEAAFLLEIAVAAWEYADQEFGTRTLSTAGLRLRKALASLDAAGGAEWKTTVGGQEHSYETNRDPDSAGGAER